MRKADTRKVRGVKDDTLKLCATGTLSQLDIRLGLYKKVRGNLTRKISES